MRDRVLFLTLCLLAAACGSKIEGTVGGPTSEFPSQCIVRFGVTNETTLAGLQVDVDYRRADGLFVGPGDFVECERIDERFAVWGTNQCRGEGGTCLEGEARVLTITAEATHDQTTPSELLECRFAGEDVPSVEDFVATVIDAYDEFVQPIATLPAVEAIDVECRSPGSTTSTTLEPSDPCDDVSCPDGEACADGECVPTTRYAVDFHVDQPYAFGALQFDVLHDCADGVFDGDDDQVRCIGNPDLNASAQFHDTDCEVESGEPRLTLSFITLRGFEGPVRVASCEYTSRTGAAPDTAALRVQVVDATDPELTPLPDTTVSIGAIRPTLP